MKITIYNMKGSAGKTPMAVNIALDREYALATNEPYNLLDTILPEGFCRKFCWSLSAGIGRT
jgi:hypothetical protein